MKVVHAVFEEHKKEMIVSFWLQSMSVEQIARVMGCHEVAVRMVLKRKLPVYARVK